MNPETVVAFAVFAGISITCALVVHRLLPRYVSASLVSGLLAAILFQVVNTIYLGFVDPFLPVAFLISFLVAAAVAFLTGLAVRHPRSR